ncbi:hypothetical protein HY496_02565 [Candidatus Woesearchaeota archaeon]|nr:hypothetical protein [Candidatus Woesearchaeota archaeon]
MFSRKRIGGRTLTSFTQGTMIQRIGAGEYGAVYRLTEDLAGKVIHPFRHEGGFGYTRITVEEAYHQLHHEEEMLTAMCQEKIAVPEPEGIYLLNTTFGGNPTRSTLFSFRRPALMMEYIAGTKISDLVDDEFRHASELYVEEKGRAMNKGFICLDTNLDNGIYQRERNRVVIVDMGLWERG